MDVLNISMDENEGDTSQEEYVDEIELQSNGCTGTPPSNKKLKVDIPCEYLYEFDCHLKKRILRPEVIVDELFYPSDSPLEAQNKPFKFMMIDCVSTVSRIKHPCILLKEEISKCPNPLVMRLYGITEHGYSISCNVHGFQSYFYALPTNTFKEEDKNDFLEILNKTVKKRILQDISCVEFHEAVVRTLPILNVEILNLNETDNVYHLFSTSIKNSMTEHVNKNKVLLKITCSLPKYIWVAAKVLRNGLISYPYTDGPCEYDLFENSINNNIRFLTDKNLPGCGWLELSAHKYYLRSDSNKSGPIKESYCQIEIDVHCDDIQASRDGVNDDISVPALRILSFDIEVITESDVDASMPAQGNKSVIQIGTTVAVYGDPDPLAKVIFTLNGCDPIEGAEVIQFVPNVIVNSNLSTEEAIKHQEIEFKNQEALMLKAWRDFVIQVDPDIITGYNINQFDLPYLIDRANLLQHTMARQSVYLGRMKNVRTVIREIKNPSKCSGNLRFDKYFVNIQGRINFDMFRLMFRHDLTRRGLSLKEVSKRHLENEVKGDVNHTEIGVLQRGSPSDRKRLAIYCLQDAYLAYQLLLIFIPDRPIYGDFVEYYFRKSSNCGALLRYAVNKSASYNQYFKEIRKQKNPHTVFFQANTPSPKRPQSIKKQIENKALKRNLFSELAGTKKAEDFSHTVNTVNTTKDAEL